MRKFIIGNWKMQLSDRDSVALAEAVVRGWAERQSDPSSAQVVICPSHLVLAEVHDIVHGTGIGLGGQDAFWEDKGAFTGEISPATLAELGAKYCIVGHSERRQHLGETDDMVNKKVVALLRRDLYPIVCVGETAEERDSGRRDSVLVTQIRAALKATALSEEQRIIVAYEPRWAIGTGRAADPNDAAEAHQLIRDELIELYGVEKTERQCAVIYGGSVTSENLGSFLGHSIIEGALVGGASLDAKEFLMMADIASRT